MNKNNKLSRRQFLQIIAVGGTIGIGSKYLVEALSSNELISETRLLMGTIVNLSVVGVDRETAQNAISSCLDHMAALENVLSRFKPESQLSVLNREGKIEDVDVGLVELIKYSRWMSELSAGAFDITIKPLLDLYNQEALNQSLPSETDLFSTLKSVNYKNLHVNGNTIWFDQANMSITLDGIAKGYIVDQGVEILHDSGIPTVMVEAGGDLMALGEKTPGTPWKIGLQAPRSESARTLTAINLKNQAVATSGDYMQSFTPDYSHHHIIDPRTGYSSTELASVSVLAPNVMLADGLATTVMVLGTNAGISLIESLPNCEALLITKTLKMSRTSGFPKE